MNVRTAARVVWWPFELLFHALHEMGRLAWYMFVASNPLTLGIWLMGHEDRHQDDEDDA